MRFRTIERVPVEDSARVLAVLEQRLRAMLSNVERDGNRITLLGLGPSSRVVNRHDTTVIDVWATDGVTNIGADVSFQALAFLGATGQEEIMRLKLERLFEETKEQLDLERRHDKARIARMEALVGGVVATAGPRRPVENREFDAPAAIPSEERPAAIAQELSGNEVVTDIAPPEEEKEEESESLQASIEKNDAIVETTSVAAPPPEAAEIVTEPAFFSAAVPVNEKPKPTSHSEAADLVESEDEPHDDGEGRSNRWMVWAVLAACITAALPFGLHYISALRTGNTTTQNVSASQPVASAPPKPVAAADPADLLRQWELAMNSRDASAQAAFYAVPVERYFLRHNVSKEQVEADMQQQIDNRKGLWNMRMEKVKIARNSDNTATVSLLKHYMQREDGKQGKEWFVPSQLKLKSEYGVWWITSERNFTLAISAAGL